MSGMVWTIEYLDELPSYYGESDARRMLDWLRINDGYLGGRVLPPKIEGAGWRVQSFFEDTPDEANCLPYLPDGCGRRLTPIRLLDRVPA